MERQRNLQQAEFVVGGLDKAQFVAEREHACVFAQDPPEQLVQMLEMRAAAGMPCPG